MKNRKTKKKNKLLLRLVGLQVVVIIALLVLVITPQGNNLLRSTFKGRSTPADSFVKKTLIKQLSKNSNNDGNKTVVEVLDTTPMPELIEATKDETKAVTLLKEKVDLDDDTANVVVDELFHNETVTKIRENIQDSNWTEAHSNFKKLKDSGELNKLYDTINQQTNLSAKSIQDEASKMLKGE